MHSCEKPSESEMYIVEQRIKFDASFELQTHPSVVTPSSPKTLILLSHILLTYFDTENFPIYRYISALCVISLLAFVDNNRTCDFQVVI
jgi:hypothetical protein